MYSIILHPLLWTLPSWQIFQCSPSVSHGIQVNYKTILVQFSKSHSFRYSISHSADDVNIYIWTSPDKIKLNNIKIGSIHSSS